MYEQLMQLPLFQGVSSERLSELIEKLPFHFLKFKAGENIINPGDACTHIRFVVSGGVDVIVRHHTLNVSLHQRLVAPDVLAPDHLFGLENSYPFTVTASQECGLLQLRKSDYVYMLQTDKIFLFNILNYLSLGTQRVRAAMLGLRQGTMAHRLALFVSAFASRRSTDLRIEYRQRDLCTMLGVQRTQLVTAIDTLTQQNIITHMPGVIDINDVDALFQYIK